MASHGAQVTVNTEGLPTSILKSLIATFGFEKDQLVDADSLQKALVSAAERYRDLQARLNRMTNDDPQVVKLRESAARLIEEGKFEAADEALERAEEVDVAAASDLTQTAHVRLRSASEARAARGDAAMLRRERRLAGMHFEAAATLVRFDEEARQKYMLKKADSLADPLPISMERVQDFLDALAVLKQEPRPTPEFSEGTDRLVKLIGGLGMILSVGSHRPTFQLGAQHDRAALKAGLSGQARDMYVVENLLIDLRDGRTVSVHKKSTPDFWDRFRAQLDEQLTFNIPGVSRDLPDDAPSSPATLQAERLAQEGNYLQAAAEYDSAAGSVDRVSEPVAWAKLYQLSAMCRAKHAVKQVDWKEMDKTLDQLVEVDKIFTPEEHPEEFIDNSLIMANCVGAVGLWAKRADVLKRAELIALDAAMTAHKLRDRSTAKNAFLLAVTLRKFRKQIQGSLLRRIFSFILGRSSSRQTG